MSIYYVFTIEKMLIDALWNIKSIWVGYDKYYPHSYHIFKWRGYDVHIHQNTDTNLNMDQIIYIGLHPYPEVMVFTETQWPCDKFGAHLKCFDWFLLRIQLFHNCKIKEGRWSRDEMPTWWKILRLEIFMLIYTSYARSAFKKKQHYILKMTMSTPIEG